MNKLHYDEEYQKLRSSYEMISAQSWGIVAIALALASTGLVVAWGQDNGPSQKGYIGQPNWANNSFPCKYYLV